ncbi:MAG: biopolymer transporter ExbD [Gammaproteobacteria bacterium]
MKKRRQPISNINVVPYLDVMLVLLVIFMITAPLFNQGVVDLPSVGDAPLNEQPAAAIEIAYTTSAVNPYRVIDHESGKESVRLNIIDLLDILGQKQILRPDTPIIISAAETLSYKDVMALLGKLQSEGYTKVGLVAQSDSGQ